MANSIALLQLTISVVIIYCSNMVTSRERAKDNGDIYVRHEEQPAKDEKTSTTSIATQRNNSSTLNIKEVMRVCNASFSIPMEYIVQFNTTGELSDTADKTGMCFVRCFMEKAGLIANWKLHKDLIMQMMWPMTADSVELCESEARSEVNACVRTYAIAKCLKKRSLEGKRNQANV